MRSDFLSALADRTLRASDSWLMGVDSSKRRNESLMTWHFDAECTEAAAAESSWTTDDGLRFALRAASGVRHPVGFDPDLTSENSADTPSEYRRRSVS